MNSRLVDSLVNLIESLDSEDYTLLLQKLTERTIQKHPNICQGYARIRNTRIPVWTLVSFRQQGANEQERGEKKGGFGKLTYQKLGKLESMFTVQFLMDSKLSKFESSEKQTDGMFQFVFN
ncbi:DUF433 domain-containing protein [Dactylococcopsis salina]|uniref:DUF433 domain-containing protein n=1 Tax=Dactylococcopsis salina TaxID=292566 RepID=UPI0002FF5DBF|nr:DUF433 domain-containing protein [Dactylococcopsis salina]